MPASKNINYKLGRLYFDQGELAKGLLVLEKFGLVHHAARLPERPRVDGVLSDPAWAGVAPLTQFHQLLSTMQAHPTEGRTEAYIGYVDDALYIWPRSPRGVYGKPLCYIHRTR